ASIESRAWGAVDWAEIYGHYPRPNGACDESEPGPQGTRSIRMSSPKGRVATI
ncbi:hypothetical protein A2U01_0116102, partial [Trifolium medium]|nr:hypothetical protein [Trifolium medium]